MKTAHTQLVSVRLPFDMIDALKGIAEEVEKPWQTVMKSLLSDALGLEAAQATPTERKLYAAPHLKQSKKRLGKKK